MFKTIGMWANNVFGPQKYETNLVATKNKGIRRMLKTIDILRFLLFPLTFSMYVIGLLLEVIVLVCGKFSRFLFFMFQMINDSLWLNPVWFGFTENELEEEIVRLEIINGEKDVTK